MNIFSKPAFDDPDKQREAVTLYYVAIGYSVVITSAMLADFFYTFTDLTRNAFLAAIINLTALMVLWLIKKGKASRGAQLQMYVLLFAGTVYPLTAGGMRARGIMVYPVIVLTIGLICGWRKGIMSGIFILLAELSFILLETYGFLEPRVIPMNLFRIWLTSAMAIFITILLLYLAVANLDKSLKETKEELRLRMISEERLKHYQLHLEELVKERTSELDETNHVLKEINSRLQVKGYELQEAIETLKKTQNQLIQSEKMASLGIISSGIAHEINNPLNFISGGISGLESLYRSGAQFPHKDADSLFYAVQTGIQRITAIVRSLGHYGRVDNSFSDLGSIHTIIDNCLVMLRGEVNSRIEIIKDYTAQPYVINGSEGKLHQAFLNILSNSVQAIAGKGEIKVATRCSEKLFTAEIEDNGCGISPENLNKIFDPFYTTKDPGKGTGLGLSITYDIIKEHGGAIEYSSEPGMGTKAVITLPLKG